MGTFGSNPGEQDASTMRVQTICSLLGVPDSVQRHILAEDILNWSQVLSLSERMLLHTARALIANPEMLVVHKPTLVFDNVTAGKVLHALRSFVDEKGLEQDPSQWMHRRPRTCFCTVSRPAGVEIADRVFTCDRTGTYE